MAASTTGVVEPLCHVELSISCSHLAKLDAMSKSDPCVVVEERRKGVTDGAYTPWREVGRTEVIKDNPEPKFTKSFKVDYYFERIQCYRFRVFDWDDKTGSLEDQQFIGELCCNLSEIVGIRGQYKKAELVNEKHPHRKNGSITVSAEEIYKPPQFNVAPQPTVVLPVGGADAIPRLTAQLAATPKEIPQVMQLVKLSCRANHLDKKDLFGKSDPYYKVYRMRQDGGGEPVGVYESEVIMKTLDPEWKAATLECQKLCNNDLQRGLKFEVYDWDKSSSHDLIGQFTTCVNEIVQSPSSTKEFQIIHEAMRAKKGDKYKNSGVFHITAGVLTEEIMVSNPAWEDINRQLQDELAKEEKRQQAIREMYKYQYQQVQNPHSFLQYLGGGCEISLIVSVDFTASNGEPSSSSSKHYNRAGQLNEYERAILAVGSILSDYDSDKKFPSFGFGGSRHHGTSHCFPLQDEDHVECSQVEGILSAYKKALHDWSLSGPTNFAPTIRRACKDYASQFVSQQSQKYFILLIITDGGISDMDETVDAIIDASGLPLSIIIVGVGNADFDSMDQLDADKKPLLSRSGKKWGQRDIVQFVPFRELEGNPDRLAEATLRELPGQLVYYMGLKGIVPNPRVI